MTKNEVKTLNNKIVKLINDINDRLNSKAIFYTDDEEGKRTILFTSRQTEFERLVYLNITAEYTKVVYRTLDFIPKDVQRNITKLACLYELKLECERNNNVHNLYADKVYYMETHTHGKNSFKSVNVLHTADRLKYSKVEEELDL